MQLRVQGESLTRAFAKWLTMIVVQQLHKSVDKRRLKSWEQYLTHECGTNISIESFWKKSLQSITYHFVDNTLIIINIDPKEYLTSNIKMSTVCKIINFGTLDKKGYPVYTDVFNKIASNIDGYIKLYNLIGDKSR